MRNSNLTATWYKCLFLFLFQWIFMTSNLKAQVVIDWAKAHGDDRIDYIGWDGEMWRATIADENQFRISKVGNHEDIIINYVNYNGSYWTARLNGDKFVHAPGGDWSKAHEDIRMDYVADDGSRCTTTINGNDFNITNHRSGKSYLSRYLYYITWDRSIWTAELAKPRFIHWQGRAQNTTVITPSLKYLTWNGTRWAASIMADGSFRHTDENGVSHLDKTMIYLNYDASIWGAQLNSKRFNHAPGFIPKDKSIWDKIIDGFKKIDIQGGFPDQHPPGSQTGEFRGILVKEESGMVYYRPVDNMGSCTNNLAWYPSANIISRSRVGSCLNLGQQRDIISFLYNK